MNTTSQENHSSSDTAAFNEVSRRDFGVLSLLSSLTLPSASSPLLGLLTQHDKLAPIFQNAHPLLTKEGIQIIYELISNQVSASRGEKRSHDSSIPVVNRLLTPIEVARQQGHYFRLFERLKTKSVLLERAFGERHDNAPFEKIIRDYEEHVRLHFLDVQRDVHAFIEKHLSNASLKNDILCKLDEIGRDLLAAEDLQQQVDFFYLRLSTLRYDIERYICDDWPIYLDAIINLINEGHPAERVVSEILNSENFITDCRSLSREQLLQYVLVAQDFEQLTSFNPTLLYLTNGKGVEIFKSLRGLADIAGEDEAVKERSEGTYYLSHFEISGFYRNSSRLFPSSQKGAVRDYLEQLFQFLCTPDNRMYGILHASVLGIDRTTETIFSKAFLSLERLSEFLLEVSQQRQLFQSMTAALNDAWPEMMNTMGATGLFESIKGSLSECERALHKLLEELELDPSQRQSSARESGPRHQPIETNQSRGGLWLSADFREYISVVRNHRDGMRFRQFSPASKVDIEGLDR